MEEILHIYFVKLKESPVTHVSGNICVLVLFGWIKHDEVPSVVPF